MDATLFTGSFAALIASVIAILGWWVVSKENIKNERRKINAEHLIDSYRILSAWVHNSLNNDQKRQIENVISDIQLFGTNKTISAVDTFMNEFRNGGNIEEMLNVLRDELRRELEIEPVQLKLRFFRFK